MKSVHGRTSVSRIAVLVLVCCLDLSTCRPAEPTKFSLNANEGSSKSDASEVTSRWDQGRELLGKVADGLRIGAGRFVNSVTLARNIIIDRAETLASESQDSLVSVVPANLEYLTESQRPLDTTQYPPVTNTRPNARETVRLENEGVQGFLERPKSKAVSGVLESFLKPTPLLDNIREEEKYGNPGDKFIGIGRALVSGFEGFSNFLNAVVDLPKNALRNTSRGLTEALNNVGAKIVGLQ